MQPCDLLLTTQVLVTQNDARHIHQPGALAISSGRVEAAGPMAEVAQRYAPAHRLDLGQRLVLPGLVNAHGHAAMTIFRGVADDLPLMDWLTRHIWPVEKKLTPRIVRLGALLACAEMLRTGTTCFSDMYLLEAETAAAVDTAGMRGVLAEGIFAFPSPAYADETAGFQVVEALHQAYAQHPRIRTAIMPHAVYTTSPELLRRAYATAQRHNVPFMLHCAETAQESVDCLARFGHRPPAYLDSLGCLSDRTTLFHGVDLQPEEIALVASRGAAVVHCPQSNMKLASGVAPAAALLQAGVTLGLGTDGAASNNALNMFREMTVAALLAKVSATDPTALPAQTVLDMATRQSAQALQWPELGRLAPGSAADLVALDLDAPNLQPLHDPVSHLVYAASGHEVTLTMVAGDVVYADGAFPRCDYPDLCAELEDIAQWVRRQNGQP